MVELNKTPTPVVMDDSAVVGRSGANEMVYLTRTKTNRQSGTSYAIVAGDIGGQVIMDGVSPSTVILPADATLTVPNTSLVLIGRAQGAGPVTVGVESGDTLNGIVDGTIVIDEAAKVQFEKSGVDAWESWGGGVAS
ncbi:hypothetical protein LX70_04010 [Defluviimonas denitrificans]|jgi:hypothetical protein|uniref:Uncharacterized protein n=1 Tax=Albidovulum denitrificans TaxID=404881 RepID=A0A2S8RWH2_9RHOB|nr:hypothetical protein [Defluviimonas denitrificans]PQV52904.1 hypothetical protein LX70_04010 [Defluviimonas denitrificans]